MSFGTECAHYGIDPDDPRYVHESEFDDPVGPRCRMCGNHAAHRPRAVCDLEAARAAEMDDPRVCVWCRKAYDFRSCEPDCDTGWHGTCGVCQERHARQEAERRERLRNLPPSKRLRLSPARARYVRLQDPHRDLHGYSNDELYRTAYDEVAD